MKRAVYNVMLITIIAKLLGFGREILLSYFFGAGGISDAYLISQTIPGTIFQFVGLGLSTSFIPIYMKVKANANQKKADYFTNTILSLILVFSTFVIILVLLFTEPVIKVFASGFSGQILEYAVLFTRIGILSLYFSAAIYVFGSYLQANGVFSVVSFVAIPNSLIIMAAIVLGAKWTILALPVGSLIALLAQVLVLWPVMRKYGYRFSFYWDTEEDSVKEAISLMLPVVIGVSVNQINVLIDRTIASQVIVGGISALMYADSLIMFVQGIFSQPIATVYYPSITKFAEEKDECSLKSALNEALGSMAFILIPVMVGCIILASQIVCILYGRGAFDETAVSMTGKALAFYGVGILGYGVREILSRVFYAFHDTGTPMKNAIAGMILNITLNIVFSFYLGIGGLALATSLSSIVTSVLLYRAVIKKFGKLFAEGSLLEYGKMGAAALIMGVMVWLSNKILEAYIGKFLGLAAAVFVGVAVYFLLCSVLKVKVLQKVIEMLLRKNR